MIDSCLTLTDHQPKHQKHPRTVYHQYPVACGYKMWGHVFILRHISECQEVGVAHRVMGCIQWPRLGAQCQLV